MYKNLFREPDGKRPKRGWRDLFENDSLGNWVKRVWIEFIWLIYGPVTGSYEYGNEYLDFILCDRNACGFVMASIFSAFPLFCIVPKCVRCDLPSVICAIFILLHTVVP